MMIRLTPEIPFLAAVHAVPEDDAPRLVYADWLEEHGHAGRADFLRLDCRLSGTPGADPTQDDSTRLRHLALTLDPDWVALVRRSRVPDAAEEALERLEDLLPNLNYVVSLDLWRVPLMVGATPERYIAAALGPKAVLGEVRPVAGPDAMADVEQCFRTPDPGGGGGATARTLASPEFAELIGRVRMYLTGSMADAQGVSWFEIRDGHPFYPVLWDFAYSWVKPWGAVVFLGSSSD